MEAPLQLARQRLAARHHPAQGTAALQPRRIQERLEHRGDEVQDGDPLLLDQFDEVAVVPVPSGVRQHQPGARHQRPEELPDRDVEAERSLLQHPVRGRKPVHFLHPEQSVADPPVGVHRSLRLPGRAGGVDHINQVIRPHTGLGRLRLRSSVFLQARIQHHEPPFHHRQKADQVLLHQDDRHLAVLQQEGQPLSGVSRVQRYIGTSRFRDREQTHDQLQRTLGADPDPDLRPDPQNVQPAGQAASQLVELPIRQGPIVAGDRHRIWRAPHLCLDQLVQATAGLRVVQCRIVPLPKLLVVLGLTEQWQVLDPGLRGDGDPFQQPCEVPQQAIDRRRVEQIRAVLDRFDQPVPSLLH